MRHFSSILCISIGIIFIFPVENVEDTPSSDGSGEDTSEEGTISRESSETSSSSSTRFSLFRRKKSQTDKIRREHETRADDNDYISTFAKYRLKETTNMGMCVIDGQYGENGYQNECDPIADLENDGCELDLRCAKDIMNFRCCRTEDDTEEIIRPVITNGFKRWFRQKQLSWLKRRLRKRQNARRQNARRENIRRQNARRRKANK